MLTSDPSSATNRRAILLALILVSSASLVPHAGAGTAANPEVTDPAGDQAVAPGALAAQPPTFENVDVLRLWISEDATNASLIFNVEAAAPLDGGPGSVALTFDFVVESGPTSVFGSTADGTAYAIVARSNGTADGADNVTVTVDGNFTRVAVPLASIGASGGDILADLVLEASAVHTGTLPIDQDDSTAVDRAPDTDFAPTYTFARSPIVAALALAVQGEQDRTVTDPDASVAYSIQVTNRGSDEDVITLTPPTTSGALVTLAPLNMTLAPGASTLTFLTIKLSGAAAGSVFNLPVTATSERGATATITPSLTVRAIGADIALSHAGVAERTTADPFARLTFTIEVENKGTDFDTITFANPTVAGAASVTVSPATVSLAAGDKATVTLSVNLNNATSKVTVTLRATSANGANATLASTVNLDVSGGGGGGGGKESAGAKAGLDFLTPAAEALGFDALFDDWAEVAVLGLILLVALLLLFLILFLPKRPWLQIEVRPRRLSVEPGETAEFQVQVRNKKKDFHRAVARLSGADPEWKAGLLLRQEDGGSLEPMTSYGDLVFGLTARDEPGDHYEGTLRVQVPETASPKSRSRVDLEIIPLDDGDERPRKGGKARIAVRAAKPMTGDSPITITDVTHEPERPEEGDSVSTTAHITNVSEENWSLDVSLLVDDRAVDEQRLDLAPGEERHVTFQWRASGGSNKVRLQVLQAEE